MQIRQDYSALDHQRGIQIAMPPTASRFAIVVLAVLLSGLVSACGQQSSQSGTGAAPAANAQPAAAAPGPAATPAGTAGGASQDESQDSDADRAFIAKKWTGDFDGMIERRLIRVLTTYSKTTFFVDKGTQLGLTAEAFRMFEDDLNKKLKTGNIRVHVVFVPVAHDDLVAAQKLITEWRREQVDFTNPTRSGISTIVVTAPGTPTVSSPQDLAGKEVYIRASDVSSKNVEKFNAELATAGKPPV